MKTAVVVYADGWVEEMTYSEDRTEYLLFGEKVGGWIELVPLNTGEFTMYCNEEGKLMGLPYNVRANDIANKHRNWEDPLVGNVVLSGKIDSDGETTSFTLEDLRRIEQ